MNDNPISEVRKSEHPMLGRKIYFIAPPLIVENILISELRDEEYEIYIIDNYRLSKSVLKNHPDALVFVHLDNDIMNYDQWFNFIKSFQADKDLKSIFLGVISFTAHAEIRQRFLMDLKLPGGFIMVDRHHIDITTEQMRNIFDLNGAKGLRKYIRLDSRNLAKVNGYFAYKDKLYMFNVDNISSVGFACYYPPKIAQIFTKNSLHPCISLTLGRKTIIASSVVFDTRLVGDKGFSVLLFTKDVDKSTRNDIRTFIFEVLDEINKKECESSRPDNTNYSIEIKLPEDDIIPQFSDVKDSFAGEMDEVNSESENE